MGTVLTVIERFSKFTAVLAGCLIDRSIVFAFLNPHSKIKNSPNQYGHTSNQCDSWNHNYSHCKKKQPNYTCTNILIRSGHCHSSFYKFAYLIIVYALPLPTHARKYYQARWWMASMNFIDCPASRLFWRVLILRWQYHSSIGECSCVDPHFPFLINDLPSITSDCVNV